MRESLRPSGIMTMIVWRAASRTTLARFGQGNRAQVSAAARRKRIQTCGPGPFSMADTGVVTKRFEIAGFKDIKFEQVHAKVFVGKDLNDAVEFQLAIGPAGEVYAKPASWPKHATLKLLRR